MRVGGLKLCGLACAIGLSGCTLLNPAFSIDTDTEGFADGDDLVAEGGEADAGLPDPCGDAARCFRPPGEAWDGPVAIYKGAQDGNVGCGGNFGKPLWSGVFGPKGEPVTCDKCSCNSDDRELLGCTGLTLQVNGSPTCQDTNPVEIPVDPSNAGTCENLEGPQAGGVFDGSVRLLPGDADARCGAAGGGVSQAPPVGVDGQVSVCGGGKDLGDCPGTEGRCVEVPDDAAVASICVIAEGDLDCPAGYPDKHLYGQTLIDDRSCSDCVCGLTDGRCSADILLWGEKDCAGQQPLDIAEGGACAGGSNGFSSVSLGVSHLLDGGTCSADPTGGQPRGGVALGDTATVCCAA